MSRSLRNKSPRRALGFEQFESRRLMAVTTSLSAGTLTITGDAAADDIAIVGTLNPGELTITGRNGTAVNGIVDGSATISGVTGNLNIDLHGGNDALSLDHVFIAAAILITTGEGDDVVTLGAHGEVSPNGNLEIETGAGNDQVYELNYAVFVGQSNFITLGHGDDIARVIGASGAGGRNNVLPGHLPGIPNSVFLSGDEGNDSIFAMGVTSAHNLQVMGRSGINSLALLYSSGYGIIVWSGNSSFDPTETPGGGGTIYLDTNYARATISVSLSPFVEGDPPFVSNSVSVFRCHSTGFSIIAGPGNNFMNVYGNAANGPQYQVHNGGVSAYFHVVSSGTRNVVHVTYNVGVRARVLFGNGDDSLTVIGNLMTESTELETGGGTNDVFEHGNSFGATTSGNFFD